MAKLTVVTMTDDLDGSIDEVSTLNFELDGKVLEIDLSAKNAARLRDTLAPFVAAARRAGSSTRQRSSAPAKRQDLTAVRNWLAENGYDVKDRGRIPTQLIAAYESRTPAEAHAAADESAPSVEFQPAAGE